MSDGTHTCEMCGEEYDQRTVFIHKDNVSTWKRRKAEYDHLCEDCDDKWHDENARLD